MKKDKSSFSGEIIRLIAPLKESETNDWIKAVAEVKWGNNPTTIDIRKMNPATGDMGRGISLSDEEANILCNTLLENDYGDFMAIKEAYEKKKNRFTVVDKEAV